MIFLNNETNIMKIFKKLELFYDILRKIKKFNVMINKLLR